MSAFEKAAKAVFSRRAEGLTGGHARCRYDSASNTLVVHREENRGEPEAWYRGAYSAHVSTSSSMLMLAGYLACAICVLVGVNALDVTGLEAGAVLIAGFGIPGYLAYRTTQTIRNIADEMTVDVAFQDRAGTDSVDSPAEVA